MLLYRVRTVTTDSTSAYDITMDSGSSSLLSITLKKLELLTTSCMEKDLCKARTASYKIF